MTEVATVSPKGQGTIPKAFRDELEIKPGDRVFFIKTEDGIAIFKPKKSLEDYRGFLKGREPEESFAEALAAHVMGEER